MTPTSASRSLRADAPHASASDYLAYPLRDSPFVHSLRLIRSLAFTTGFGTRNEADGRAARAASVPPADHRPAARPIRRVRGKRGVLRHPRGFGFTRG